jgi:hypothetical protein
MNIIMHIKCFAVGSGIWEARGGRRVGARERVSTLHGIKLSKFFAHFLSG